MVYPAISALVDLLTVIQFMLMISRGHWGLHPEAVDSMLEDYVQTTEEYDFSNPVSGEVIEDYEESCHN